MPHPPKEREIKMTSGETIKINKIIGKALRETAHEAYLARIKNMLARPFDEVVQAIRNHNFQNKGNGYFVSEAIRYFDNRLETEYENIWYQIEDTASEDWIEAIEIFRW